MKIAIFADLHVGNHRAHGGPTVGGKNRRCQWTLNVLKSAMRLAEEHDCTDVIVAGDLFDISKPEPKLVFEVGDLLQSHLAVWLLNGNHDRQSDEPRHNALAPLHLVPNISVLERPIYLRPDRSKDHGILLVPFKGGKADSWFFRDVRESVERAGFDRTTLVTHLGLRDGSEPSWLAKAHDSIDCAKFAKHCNKWGIDKVIAGNWHFRKRWIDAGVDFFQLGAVCPTGYDNAGTKNLGTVAILDHPSGEIEVYEVSGPRFVKFQGLPSRGELEKLEKYAHESGCPIFTRWQVCRDEEAEAREMVAKHRLNGEAEIVISSADVKAAARSASIAARSAESLEESLAAYIENMDHTDSDPEQVRALCKSYLSVGG